MSAQASFRITSLEDGNIRKVGASVFNGLIAILKKYSW
jgi:hypothetical protein